MTNIREWTFCTALLVCLHVAHADPAQPIDPVRFVPLLPAAWGGMERSKPEAVRNNDYRKNSVAEANYRAGGGGSAKLELVFRISDEGAYKAKMYKDYGADYLKNDVTNDSQKTLVVNGRRFLQTRSTKTSFGMETFVGDRFGFNLACMNATEAQCVAALGKMDFAGLEKLKP